MLVKLESIAGNEVSATTSLKIAEFTEKRHADVLRDIENLVNSGKFTERNFALSSHKV
jgi:phage regulator Rha-like protein